MVADLVAGSVGADGLHDACTFVTAGDGKDPGHLVAGGEVVVRMAEAGGDHPDTNLVLAQLVEFEVDNLVSSGTSSRTAPRVFICAPPVRRRCWSCRVSSAAS